MVLVYDSSSLKVICQGKVQFSQELGPSFEEDEEEDKGIETSFSRGCREEMAYLLLVILQSYLKCCSGEYTAWSLLKDLTPLRSRWVLWSIAARRFLVEYPIY